MKLSSAHRIIEDTFEHGYDEVSFRHFVGNLLVKAELKESGHRAGQMIYESFRDHVAQYKRIAKYVDPYSEELDVLAVKFKTPYKLERARTMQRNFVATYLNDANRPHRDAALVAYYADGTDDWRLSLVRLEYRTVVDEEGTVTTEKNLTPVRYSFLVGAGESSHTAQKQFEQLVKDESSPLLDTIADAFDIEVVTDEFFDDYRSRYLTLAEEVRTALDDDATAQEELKAKGVTAGAFAKKLMGQLVFLYFLQKKGWLGLQKGEQWGEGPANFLRQLYEKEYVDYSDFYQDLLDPLFYDALATDRGSNNYFGRLKCCIPFLNGGLFEPIGNFDRPKVDLALPNEVFGDIFDTFDRYNFTVREDEPLDKEVAVDPEMLGKVFEKMLDVEQRKEKGAFYTPRDIVHYICQQSLIDHLDVAVNTRMQPLTQSEAQQSDFFRGVQPQQLSIQAENNTPLVQRRHLEALVRDGMNWIEHDGRVENGDGTGQGGKYDGTYHAPQPIRTHAEEIDAALAHVKVCDPAVGSGAFPVGMMQEIVQARRVLDTYIDDGIERSTYALKRHAIQETIHGVDIEPSAIDIAQLRLWLSLVVDEEDFGGIKPLPNLRYKIVQGDALQRMERNVFNNEKEDRLHHLMDEYVGTSYPSQKEQLQAEIDGLLGELLDKSEFDFRLYFGTVWEEQGGFDIVIGNPPYVRQESIKELKPILKKQYPETYRSKADLYVYFIAQGIRLLKESGHLCYITSNSYLNASFSDKLLSLLKKRTTLRKLINFGETPVFDATTEPAILLLRRGVPPKRNTVALKRWVESDPLETLRALDRNSFIIERQDNLGDERWIVETREVIEIIEKLECVGEPLGEVIDDFYRGVVTGRNKAFVVNEATRDRLIEEDPTSTEIIGPFLRGSDISRYDPARTDDYLLFTRRGIDIDKYPVVKAHLEQYREILEPKPKGWKPNRPGESWPGRKGGSYKWYEIQDTIDYFREFSTPKIIYQDIARYYGMTWDESGAYLANTCYFIPNAEKWMLGVLLSSTMRFYVYTVLGSDEGRFIRLFSRHVKHFPLPQIENTEPLERLVDRQLTLHARRQQSAATNGQGNVQEQIDATDREIDQLVYELYGLTEEEIGIVEESLNS